jgi:hypothetical protein
MLSSVHIFYVFIALLINVLCSNADQSVHNNDVNTTLGSFLSKQHQNINSLQFNASKRQNTNTVIDNEYYGEVVSVSSSKKGIGIQSDNPPSHMSSIMIEYNTYHPTDQIWGCYSFANYAHNQELRLDYQQDQSRTLRIPGSLLKTFLSCCPTIYTPNTDPEYLYDIELEIDLVDLLGSSNSRMKNVKDVHQNSKNSQHFEHFKKVGCGHSQTLVPVNDLSTGSQTDEYPRKIDKFGYRNTPNPWYYDKDFVARDQDPNQSLSKVITYAQFSVNFDLTPFSYQNEAREETRGANLGNLELIRCGSRSFSQSGEGYHRELCYEFDLSSCEFVTVDKDTKNTQKETKELKKMEKTQKLEQNSLGRTCQYYSLLHLPNSIFIDPYQISYIDLARHNQLQRDLLTRENGETNRIEKHPQNNQQQNIKTLTNLDLFLYDFIDVEAQMNNAVGNNVLIKMNDIGTQNDPRLSQFKLPVHLRYAPSQFKQYNIGGVNQSNIEAETPFFSFFSEFLNTNIDAIEPRFRTHLIEPILFRSCIGDTTKTEQSGTMPVIPNIETVFDTILFSNQNYDQLPSLNLSIPVGDLTVFPIAFILTILVLIITALFFHCIILVRIKSQK